MCVALCQHWVRTYYSVSKITGALALLYTTLWSVCSLVGVHVDVAPTQYV